MNADEVIAEISKRLGRPVRGELRPLGQLDLFTDVKNGTLQCAIGGRTSGTPIDAPLDFTETVVRGVVYAFAVAIAQAEELARRPITHTTITGTVEV